MTKNKNGSTEYLVIIGVGSDDKPHAARFIPADEALVRKAAELMWLRLGRATDEPSLKLVRKLPYGKIFGSGKALVPLVKAEFYDELLKVLSFDLPAAEPAAAAEAPTNGTETANAQTGGRATDPWDAISVGTVVLVFQDDKEGTGWWEAVVISVSKDRATLSLRWRDWPERKKFTRPRRKVGILAAQA